jgi:hypothetical protein
MKLPALEAIGLLATAWDAGLEAPSVRLREVAARRAVEDRARLPAFSGGIRGPAGRPVLAAGATVGAWRLEWQAR